MKDTRVIHALATICLPNEFEEDKLFVALPVAKAYKPGIVEFVGINTRIVNVHFTTWSYGCMIFEQFAVIKDLLRQYKVMHTCFATIIDELHHFILCRTLND